MEDRKITGPMGLAAEWLEKLKAKTSDDHDAGTVVKSLRGVILNDLHPDPSPPHVVDPKHELETLRKDIEALKGLPEDGAPVAAETLLGGRRTSLVSDLRDAASPDRILWRENGSEDEAILSVGEICLLSGAGGLGKSSVVLALAHAAATGGGAACGMGVLHGPVMLSSFEDSHLRLARRLRWFAGGAAVPDLYTWPDPAPLFAPGPTAKDGRRVFEVGTEWVRFWSSVRRHGCRLVVIDPATVALVDAPLNDSGPIRQFLLHVAREAQPRDLWVGCGVLIVTHDTKAARTQASEGGNPGAGVVAGSSAWFDGARGVLALQRQPKNPERLVMRAAKCNYGPTGWGALLRERNGSGFAGYQLLRPLSREELRAALEPSDDEESDGTSKPRKRKRKRKRNPDRDRV